MFLLYQGSFLEKLNQLDQWLFMRINSGVVNPFFDSLMPFMRTGMHWVPLYLFVCVFAVMNFRAIGAWWSVLLLATVALTDMTGTYVFKKGFERIRPCNDPDFYTNVRLLVDHCSGGFSFVSNHAANHFGLAAFFFITTRPLIKNWAYLGLAWALTIGFAQIYVGVHYPFDVLAGALLGLIFGYITGTIFNKRYGIAIFDNQPTLSS